MINKKAFTLTELLVAMGIIGTIAAMSIPSLMNNINNTLFTTNLKGFVQSIKQTVDAQLLAKRTTTLENTDFAKPALLFQNYFDAVKVCDYTQTDCWQNVEYKNLNGGNPYKLSRQTTALLKNGATVLYNRADYYDENGQKGELYAEIYIDLNGAKKPNIVGRDFFQFYLSKDGKISPTTSLTVEDYTDKNSGEVTPKLKTFRQGCKNGLPDSCFGYIMLNGWRMNY